MPPLPRSLRSAGRRQAVVIGAMLGALAIATAVAAGLRIWLGLTDTSAVYLLAVLAVGGGFGTWPAIATSLAAFLVYDFLFVSPSLTLAVAAAEDWLNLLLFLAVAVVIGRLAALQAARGTEAARRAREARALFEVSRDLATSARVGEAVEMIVRRLPGEAHLDRAWFGVGPAVGRETLLADSVPGAPLPPIGSRLVLRRGTEDGQPRWTHVRDVEAASRPVPEADGGSLVYRVPLDAGGEPIGSLWATRSRAEGEPSRAETRFLSATADQVALAIHRDRLSAATAAAEVARQSDALKSALLDSVSHDLRTPLAAIRAAAGRLVDPDVPLSAEDERAIARSIDGEAVRMAALVRNILDLSRIEGGALRPRLAVYELGDLVAPAVDRVRRQLEPADLAAEVPDDLPPVQVDATYVDQALGNLLENAIYYAGPAAPVRVRAAAAQEGSIVTLVVEDGGPGVPPDALPHLFDKFYRVARPREGSRRGMGIGLAVVRGLVEASGGTVAARQSELGGLAVELTLPAVADVPMLEPGEPSTPNEPSLLGEPSQPTEPAEQATTGGIEQ